jgi:endonuclease YncB( thermonuclease family)
MARTYHFIIPLLSIFLVRVDLTDLYPLHLEASELQVLDGDTVRVKLGGSWQKVRLQFIDAPELGQDVVGEKSANCLKKNLSFPWIIKVDGFDLYGRILGDVNGVSIHLIQEGCAYLYTYARFHHLRQKGDYLRAQDHARRLKRGLWNFKVLNPGAYRKSRAKFQ